jgi:membrane associated rhomboid family serine protease
MQQDSLRTFFRYLVGGFVMAILTTHFEDKTPRQVLWDLFTRFMYCAIAGIWAALFGMFGTDLYFWLKKKLKRNEQRCSRVFIRCVYGSSLWS